MKTFNVWVKYPTTPAFLCTVDARDKEHAKGLAYEKYEKARGVGHAPLLRYTVKATRTGLTGIDRHTKVLGVRRHFERACDAVQVITTSILLPVDVANLIEAALLEGFKNCGEDPECVWAEPLALLRAARGK